MTTLHVFALIGAILLIIDLSIVGFLWWYLRVSEEEMEEMDRYVEEKQKTEKRPFAG